MCHQNQTLVTKMCIVSASLTTNSINTGSNACTIYTFYSIPQLAILISSLSSRNKNTQTKKKKKWKKQNILLNNNYCSYFHKSCNEPSIIQFCCKQKKKYFLNHKYDWYYFHVFLLWLVITFCSDNLSTTPYSCIRLEVCI